MEETIGRLHPQVIHFVVASIFVGLPLYLLALARRARGLRATATILLAVGTLASIVAVRSGLAAHESIENTPGLRPPIQKHEELGEIAQNVLIGLLVAEVLSLWLARSAGPSATQGGRRTAARGLQALVAVGWVAGAGVLFEAAEHGGDLVYAYAGGVGTRSGEPEDVGRLLLAGLYNQAVADRAAGRPEDAARLLDELARRFPADPQVRLVHAESQVEDRKDGRAALDELTRLSAPDASLPAGVPAPVSALRTALVRADAYLLLGLPDSARAALTALPENARARPAVAERLRKLGG